MKTQKLNKQNLDDKITIYRYKQKEMEDFLYSSHDKIIKETAISLGKDLAERNKPEESCNKEQAYSGVISGPYNKLMMQVKTDLQTEIEEYNIVSDNDKFDLELKELDKELTFKENSLRLKNRELSKEDNTLLKKEKRYKKMQIGLIFIILIDMLISSASMQAMGYSLVISYLIGLGIGIGIYFFSERLPLIIAKGRTKIERRAIAIISFSVLVVVFYVLGIFRTINFSNGTAIGQGAKPIYFTCLNMFFVMVATTVSWFNRLTPQERKTLDQWKLKMEEVKALQNEIGVLKTKITQLRSTKAHSELSRKQLLLYARDIQELIQRLYEEAFKVFMSTNLVHRSDGKIPKFFNDDVPKLTVFYTNLKL